MSDSINLSIEFQIVLFVNARKPIAFPLIPYLTILPLLRNIASSKEKRSIKRRLEGKVDCLFAYDYIGMIEFHSSEKIATSQPTNSPILKLILHVKFH